MKKWKSMLLAGLLLCQLAACGGIGNSAKQTPVPLPGDEEPAEAVVDVTMEPLPLAGLMNPLSGQPALEGAVDGQRPVAVMVANGPKSLPQRGLATSDVLLETVDESGYTTLMALYGDFRMVPQVGPVEYTRDQYVQFAVPSNAILAHIGASVYAENLLNVLAYQDVDGTYLGTTCFVYDTPRGTSAGGDKPNEDCWFTDANMIFSGAGIVGINPIGEVHNFFQFTDTKAQGGTEAFDIAVSYTDQATATFHYDENNLNYLKTAYGAAHADEDGTQYYFDNVILLNCNIGQKADSPLPEFDLTGGTGYYFAGGSVTEIQWRKGGPTSPLRLIGPDGTELPVQRGRSYIGILPAGRENAVSYNNQAEREAARAEAERLAAEQAAAEQAAAEQAAAEQAAAEAAAAASAPPAEAVPPA